MLIVAFEFHSRKNFKTTATKQWHGSARLYDAIVSKKTFSLYKKKIS